MYGGYIHMWQVLRCGGCIPEWREQSCVGEYIDMWEVLTCGGYIHVWRVVLMCGGTFTCGRYSHVEGIFMCIRCSHVEGESHMEGTFTCVRWRVNSCVECAFNV